MVVISFLVVSGGFGVNKISMPAMTNTPRTMMPLLMTNIPRATMSLLTVLKDKTETPPLKAAEPHFCYQALSH